MAANSVLITNAFRLAGILADGIPLSSEHAAAGLIELNDMLAAWDADNIDVGWIPQTSVTATCPVYSDAMVAVRYGLAIALCAAYGRQVPLGFAEIFGDAYGRLRREAVVAEMKEADMGHLPGSPSTFSIENG